ncbi:MAG: PH domain-containing protein [Fimbriimonadaceae bacterium]
MAYQKAPVRSPTDSVQNWRRLHVATIAIEFLKVLRSILGLLAIILLTRSAGGREDASELPFVILGSLTVFGALAKYLTYSFAVSGGNLIIRSGWLFRQNRTIPIDRIQNIGLKRGVVHRMLGVVDLEIETASGRGAEATISVLGIEEAERFRQELLGSDHRPTMPAPTGTKALVPERLTAGYSVYKAHLGELMLAGATSNRAGAILAFFSSLIVIPGTVPELRELHGRFLQVFGGGSGSELTAYVSAALFLILGGWVIAIVQTVVQYYGFEIRQGDGKLYRKFGLLTTIENVIPQRRIQMLRIRSPIVQRWLGYCSLDASTAGTFAESEPGGRQALCPIVSIDDSREVSRRVLPGYDPSRVVWTPVHPATVFLTGLRISIVLSVLMGLAVAYLSWSSYGFAAVVAVAFGVAYLQYRARAYSTSPDFVVSRSGVLTQDTCVVPIKKIQHVLLTQSPAQRRWGLASIRVATAAEISGGHLEIVDIPLSDAEALQTTLTDGASAAGAWLPDGV